MWPCGSGFSLFCVLFSRFIHVTAGDSTSFISMAEYYSMIWMYHLAFTHSSVDGTFYSWGYWGLEERRKSSYWTTFGVSDLWELDISQLDISLLCPLGLDLLPCSWIHRVGSSSLRQQPCLLSSCGPTCFFALSRLYSFDAQRPWRPVLSSWESKAPT